jgi:hypothetical protein
VCGGIAASEELPKLVGMFLRLKFAIQQKRFVHVSGSQGGLAIALSVSFLFRARREEAKFRLRRCNLIGWSISKMPKFWIFAPFF